MKTLQHLITQPLSQHWVGDGFPVRTLFDYRHFGETISPFLLFDYAGPYDFPPTTQKLGVGEHPHRGFSTVTIVYSGQVQHRDSTGAGGIIGPGDVQWMNAGSGVVHEEFHTPQFAQQGGRFEVVQLWVNSPARQKMSAPSYQAITAAMIPEIPLPNEAGQVRVIAGDWHQLCGPAQSFTPMNVWDLRLRGQTQLPIPAAHSAAIAVLDGIVVIDGTKVSAAQVAILSQEGADLELRALEDAKVLVLSGQVLNEPIAGRGPFVMNTMAEIHTAITDYQSGKMGHLP